MRPGDTVPFTITACSTTPARRAFPVRQKIPRGPARLVRAASRHGAVFL